MITKDEAQTLCDNLHKIADQVPNGLSDKLDALTIAILDLTAYYRHGIVLNSMEKSTAFARSVPRFSDFDSDEYNNWLINDQQHLALL